MKTELPRTPGSHRGFALVLVIVLLGLLVMVVYALAGLSRIEAQASATSLSRRQSRQHALAALAQGLGELQVLAGPDDRLTGMAGMTGIPPGRGRATRHWCGVWTTDGALLGWLASGSAGLDPALTTADALTIFGEGALGADGSDKEHVRVGLLPVEYAGDDGAERLRGRFAWWVADEGVKLSAVIPPDGPFSSGVRHAIDELIPSVDPESPLLAQVESFEQIAFIRADPLPPSALQANRHVLGRTHLAIVGAGDAARWSAGRLNVNTTALRFWRGVAATFDRGRAPDERLGISSQVFAQRMRDGFAAAEGAGKRRGGPFQSVAAFLAGDLLAAALRDSGVSPEQFAAGLGPWLAVRSDTFRIRAYGDSRNAADPARIEAAAWCEAIVQRSPEEVPGHGRRFVVAQFRWLGPDEI